MGTISMTITSFWYLVLLAIGFLVYYIFPKKRQWIVLLIMSLIFYYFAATPYTFIFILFSTTITYSATAVIDYFKERKRLTQAKCVLAAAIVFNVVPWLLTSGSDLWISGLNLLQRFIGLPISLQALPIVSAMGMAYYTCQIISYMVDCYWGTVERQKNPVKLLVFVSFFPQLTSGPISRYNELKSIFEGHSFQYKNLCFGAQRILWGFFKKLVVADRIGIILDAIWEDFATYTGLWRWIALLLYPLLLYVDFSGCLDIVLGSAELFGIHLEENFNNPFFSKNIREFWGRWHITLGRWAKDYIMYPILKSPYMVSMIKSVKRKMGKRMGKFIPAAIASGAVWLVMGIWHGGIKYIIGVSLYYWLLIELEEFFEPYCKKITEKLQINTERFSWRLFQCMRTYFICAFGIAIFRATSLPEAYTFIKQLFFDLEEVNAWIFFDGSVLNTGVTWGGVNLIIIGAVLLLTVAFLRERYGYARQWIAGQGVVFRWFIWIFLFVLVLICGAYGPGYDASEFIYAGF